MGISILDATQAQYVMTFGRSVITHALPEDWSDTDVMGPVTLCKRSGGVVDSLRGGETQEVTCKRCVKLMLSLAGEKNTAAFVAELDAQLVRVVGTADVPACITTADGEVKEEFDHAAYVAELNADPAVIRMRKEAAAWELELLAAPVVAVQEPLTAEEKIYTASRSEDVPAVLVPVVAVIQDRPGMNGVTHYHSPECRDIQREMKRWGQKEDDVLRMALSSVAEILAFEFGDIAGDRHKEGTSDWWVSVVDNSNELVRIMPCLSHLPAGTAGDCPLIITDNNFRFGVPPLCAWMADDPHRSCEAGDYIGQGMYGSVRVANYGDLCEFHKDEMNQDTSGSGFPVIPDGPMTGQYDDYNYAADIISDGSWIDPACGCERFADPAEVPCPDHAGLTPLEAYDAGFTETLMTKEYHLSVCVDEITGASVDLGWVALTLNAAQAHDLNVIADAYGKAHGTGKPRNGWASVIAVHEVCDI